METKSQPNGKESVSKPRELGYKAQQQIDNALMAMSVLMRQAGEIMSHDLTREGIYKAVGLILKEGSEVLRILTEAKYLGK
jgi:hypothetical protein